MFRSRPLPSLLPAAAGLLLLACEEPPSLSEVTEDPGPGTVMTLSWTTGRPTHALVEYGIGALDHTLELPEAATRASAHLLGLAPGLEAEYRVTVFDGDAEVGAAEGTFNTRAQPRTFPSFLIEGEAGEDAGWVVTSMFGGQGGALLLDTAGTISWWATQEGAASVTDAQLTPDGRDIEYLRFNTVAEDPANLVDSIGEIVARPVFGGETSTTDIHPGHHAFVHQTDGTLLWPVYDFREVDGVWVRGDTVMKRTPDGTVTAFWSTWDTFTYDPGFDYDGSGWTHVNGLTWDETDGATYVSIRNLNCVVKLDEAGKVVWQLGGADSDFTFSGRRTFTHQHRLRPLENGHVIVFDNGANAAEGSRVVEFALDEAAGTATEVWSYEPGLFVYSLGDLWRLPSGNTLVSWGTLGRFELIDGGGESFWSMSADIGEGFGFGEPLASLDGFGG